MRKIIKKEIGLFVLLVFLGIIPRYCQGFFLEDLFDDWFSRDNTTEGETRVINKINVSSNTGGNEADNGTSSIKEGKKEIKVEVKNVINGVEIEPIEIEVEANKVKVENKIETDGEGDEIKVEREVEIDSKKSTHTYEVSLENPQKIETSSVGIKENEAFQTQQVNFIKKWYLGLVENLKSFFQNLINIINL